jgi:hypothetical protein
MSGSIHRRAPLLGILALAVAGIGVTQVSGVIPNKRRLQRLPHEVHGGAKVINYPKVKCAKGQRLIRWGQQGPAGPQGAAGAQGAQGPQGPAGPADWNAIPNKPGGFADGVDNEGVTSVRIRTATSTTPVNINAGNSGMDTADCPAGFLAVGGGHQGTILPILTPSLAFIESRALERTPGSFTRTTSPR